MLSFFPLGNLLSTAQFPRGSSGFRAAQPKQGELPSAVEVGEQKVKRRGLARLPPGLAAGLPVDQGRRGGAWGSVLVLTTHSPGSLPIPELAAQTWRLPAMSGDV